jgi:transcriptional regulator with XRE-family HTH domain
VPTRERPVDRGHRLAASDRARIGRELRAARGALGLPLEVVGPAAGVSPSQAGRIERAELPTVSLDQLARLGAVVGLDVRTRTYPGPDPALDAAQLALLERLRRRLHRGLLLRTEVPLPLIGDQRAFDATIARFVDRPLADVLPVEAESRLLDIQAQHRRIRLKLRDAGFDAVVLVVADTHLNRASIAAASSMLTAEYPVPARHALAALREGRHPGASTVLVL